jgi:hypothetical protein
VQGVYFAAFVALPALAAVLLLGPLRKKERREILRLYGGFAGGALLAALVVAMLRPTRHLDLFLAVSALLVLPVTGVFVALRLDLVRSDRRAAWVLLPLGYLAGCGLAVQVLFSLGFGISP